MPKFPTDMNTPTPEEALSQIISSIAMEELGLSHIINAEGEKIQFVLGTLEGSGLGYPEHRVDVDDLLKVNESVQKMLETISFKNIILKAKLSDALSALSNLDKDCPEIF
jgi:hypothetical protein